MTLQEKKTLKIEAPNLMSPPPPKTPASFQFYVRVGLLKSIELVKLYAGATLLEMDTYQHKTRVMQRRIRPHVSAAALNRPVLKGPLE